MSSQLIIRIDKELKNKVSRFALAEGKNASQVVREMLEQYVSDRDISGHIDGLWNRIGRTLNEKGIHQQDVDTAIRNVRKNR
jgi:metal-responsive CopG/Arc/MetJ family transcriptional regulator